MSGRLGLADGDANSRRARKSLQEVVRGGSQVLREKAVSESIEGFSVACTQTLNFLSCLTWLSLSTYFPLY